MLENVVCSSTLRTNYNSKLPMGGYFLLKEIMDIICWSAEPVTLDSCLLPESHPKIQSFYNEVSMIRQQQHRAALLQHTQAPSHPFKRQRTTLSWAKQHRDKCEEKGVDFAASCGPPREIFDMFPGLYKLSARQLDALGCLGVKFPEKEMRSVDLGPQLARQHVKVGGTGCVKPTMLSYLTHKCRTALGVEAMHMQGIHYGVNHNKLLKYPDSFLTDIAGNAFEANS